MELGFLSKLAGMFKRKKDVLEDLPPIPALSNLNLPAPAQSQYSPNPPVYGPPSPQPTLSPLTPLGPLPQQASQPSNAKMDLIAAQMDSLRIQYETLSERILQIERMVKELLDRSRRF